MLETAENLRRRYISRCEQDERAATAHRRAVAAQNSGGSLRRSSRSQAGWRVIS